MLTARLHVVDAVRTALRRSAPAWRAATSTSPRWSPPRWRPGLSTLVEDERQLGATVLDMGGGTTGMAVFAEGQLLHTSQLPVGGQHVTNDIARVLSTPVAHAERLKTLYGSAQASPDDEREMLPVPLVGEDDHQIAKVPRSMVVSIIKPRLEETFEMVRERIEGSGLGRAAGTRVVLTGGASQLSGAREMASAHSGPHTCGSAGRSRCAACPTAPPDPASPPPSDCSPGPPALGRSPARHRPRCGTARRTDPPHRRLPSRAHLMPLANRPASSYKRLSGGVDP